MQQTQAPPQGIARLLAIAAILLVMLGVMVANFLGGAPAPPVSPADPRNAQQIAAGQAIYVARCARCHGANLEGQPNWTQELPGGGLPAPPHDASGHTWHHADKLLFAIVKRGPAAVPSAKGRSTMPAFDGVLSDTEIWAVLAYIKSTWPVDLQAAQEQVSQQARSR